MKFLVLLLLTLAGSQNRTSSAEALGTASRLLNGELQWTVGEPLVLAANRPEDPCYSVKDPSIVFYQNRWHLFCTIRSQKRTHQIEYLSFADWKEANAAPRRVLTLTDGYFCAPEVFYFSPQKKWYLICQVSDGSRRPSLQPAYSTNPEITEPNSWSRPKLFYDQPPPNIRSWIDFWVICDDTKAHLFFTSNDGNLWRAETKRADFPANWSQPEVVLRDDIFEASHTYRLKGLEKYLTIVEARTESRRYYKAYLADRLDGQWKPIAASKQKPFASPVNVQDRARHWADSFSHGELIRAGYDEYLQVDPVRLGFLFQGVTDQAQRGKSYGEIPWQLGLLEAAERPSE